MAPFALATLVAAGCGEEFGNGDTGGGGGASTTTSTGADGATSSAGTGSPGPSCRWGLLTSAQCGAGLYCDDSTCGAPSDEGECVSPTKTVDAAKFEPFCGCDRVTYWNAGYAARKRMSGKSGYCPMPPDEQSCVAVGGTLVVHSSGEKCEGAGKICLVVPSDGCAGGTSVKAQGCAGECTSLCGLIEKKQGFRDQPDCK